MSEEIAWTEPQAPEEIMASLIRTHKVEKVYVLYSGGKDSNCVDHYVAENYPEIYGGRLFTNTSIAMPGVRRFVIENSRKMGRPLYMTWPRRTYHSIVMKYGFPGVSVHGYIMHQLKFESWRYFAKWRSAHERMALISGVRKKESWARNKKRLYTRKPVYEDSQVTLCTPFLYKNGEQLLRYFIEHGLEKSPAYDFMDISGECLCGCFAQPWELTGLKKGAPFIFETIQWMERQVQERIAGLESRRASLTDDEKENLKQLKRSPRWGGTAGTEAAVEQESLDLWASEDLCGESCAV